MTVSLANRSGIEPGIMKAKKQMLQFKFKNESWVASVKINLLY